MIHGIHAVCLSLCLTGHWVFRHAVSETRRVLIPSPLCGPWANLASPGLWTSRTKESARDKRSGPCLCSLCFLVSKGFASCLLSFFPSLLDQEAAPPRELSPHWVLRLLMGTAPLVLTLPFPPFHHWLSLFFVWLPDLVTLPWPRVTPVPRLWLSASLQLVMV